MSSQNISGLASGLDTSTIVTQLMQIEARPKIRLQQKQAVEQARQQALNDVKTRLTNLQTQITALRDVGTWADTQSVDSSDTTKLTASRTGGAAAGAFQVAITDLARADQYKSATLTTVASGGNLTVGVGASSISVTVAAGASLETIASSINGSSGTPVYASVVNSQLVLSGRTTGASNTIAIGGDSALTTELGFTRSITASNAAYTLDGVAKTSSTNVVTDALPGVQLVLKAATASAVTVSVGAPAPSTATIQSKIQGFVDQYNSTVEFINGKLTEKKVATPQNASDRAKGVLFGDTALSGLLSQMRTSVSDLTSGRPSGFTSLAEVGLTTGAAVGSGAINKDALNGKLSLNTTKLTEKLSSSLADVKALFTNPTGVYGTQGLAQRLDNLVTGQISSGGAIASRISSSQSQVTAYTRNIADWDTRLALRQKTLTADFTTMESALSRAQSQGSWLAGQLNSLPSWR